MKTFIVGSTYFFKNIKDFKSKDIDEVEIVEPNLLFKYNHRIHVGKKDIIQIVRRDKKDILDYTLNNADGMVINRFLIPELNEEFGITFDDVKTLAPLLNKLDVKHEYLRNIFNAYVANNAMVLTDKQRNDAYQVYKNARTDKTRNNKRINRRNLNK